MSAIGQIIVNEQGGLEIPRDICEQAGLHPGVRLLVEKNGDGEIHLRPSENETVESVSEEAAVSEEAELIEKNGMLVVKVRGAENLDIVALIEQDREERMRCGHRLRSGEGAG